MSWRPAGRGRPEPATGGTVTDDGREPSAASPPAGTRGGPPPDNAGWTIFSYLIAGMVVYGLLGWLLATLTHVAVLTAAGALTGLLIAVGGIIYKYGRP
jgi:ATP synthase protein I